jgi:hypothetical protein
MFATSLTYVKLFVALHTQPTRDNIVTCFAAEDAVRIVNWFI